MSIISIPIRRIVGRDFLLGIGALTVFGSPAHIAMTTALMRR